MSDLNDHLAAVLDIAAEIQEDNPKQPNDAAGAFRYAVLKRLEDDLGLPVMVKYGDADAVRDEMGVSNDRVWGATPDGDYTLFRIEETEPLSANETRLLERTMLAAGAWYVGSAGVMGQESWTHHHYVWPEDHPALEMMPRTA